MASRGQNAQGRTSSRHFDFEEFKEHAISAHVLQPIEAQTCEQFKKLINELESSIKKRNKYTFELKLCDLERLVKDKKIRKLEILKDLRDKWMFGKLKGGDFFQFINMKGDSLPPSVSSATTISREKKGDTSNKLGENVDVQRLRKIAEILDDENQEKGAKQKKPSDVDDLLTKIEEACQEVVERRKKSAMEGVNKFASFKPLVIWATEFGKCVEKKTFMEDGIDPSTTNAYDKDVIKILEQLNRSMKLLYAQKQEQDSLEKKLKKKANELMLLLKKKPSGSKDQNIESMDTVEVIDICISELKIRLQLEVGSDECKESTKIEKQTKDDYMAMSSKIASAQLTDNNPNIADLSDQNRPTKLAEIYSDIYDDEWTDAYTYLEKKIEKEPKRIEKLLLILLNVYDVCCKIRDQQLQGMTTAILRPAEFYRSQNVQQVAETRRSEMKSNIDTKLDSVQYQTLTNIGKQYLATTIDDVIQYFKTEHKELFEAEPMDRYSTKLIRLCWLMRLHLPPLCIDSIEVKGSKFDKTKYRSYTKSGRRIEFVVWPTLLLYENGGILKQGTAQGF